MISYLEDTLVNIVVVKTTPGLASMLGKGKERRHDGNIALRLKWKLTDH